MTRLLGLFILLGITASITEGQDLRIIPNPSDGGVRKATGEGIVFQCFVDNIGTGVDPQLVWFDQLNREIQDRTGRKYIENEGPDTLKLYIDTIRADDAGTYTCRGRINGNQAERRVNLTLYQDITFEDARTSQNPRIYTDAIILCRVTGQPTPTVSWRYEDGPVYDGGRYSYLLEGLRINNITEADNGDYLCRASAEERFDSLRIHVEVYIPPTITQPLGQNEGIEGQQATIECRSQAKPDAKYEFFRKTSGDAQYQLMSSIDRIIVDRDFGSVTFQPLNRADDGEYICRAENDVGYAESTGFLNVIVPPKIIRLENTSSVEGGSAELTCHSEGDPAPTMTFQKAGEQPYAYGANDGGRIMMENIVDNNLKLTINDLRPTDTHNYTCRTDNRGGTFFRNGTITVQFSPRFAADHVTEYYSWIGRRRNLTCYAQGEPEPTVKWFRYNVELRSNETYVVYREGRTSRLQVYVQEGDQSWIYGVYQCRAENIVGGREELKELDVTLKRAQLPGAPESAEILDQSPTMVVLRVQPPLDDGGMPLLGYRVEYDGFMEEFDLGEEIKIENMQPTTTYRIDIRAKTEVGWGREKLEFPFTTESIRVPFPIVLTSHPDGVYPYSYVLRWERPRTGGLAIREYKFNYRRVSVFDGTYDIRTPQTDFTVITVQDDEDRPMRSYTLGELKPSAFYQVEVRARNDIGWSIPNPEFVFSTAEGYDGGGGNTEEYLSDATGLHIMVSKLHCFISVLICAASWRALSES